MENSTKTQFQNSLESEKQVEKDQPFSYALQLVSSGSVPMALYTAVNLDLFEIIAKAGHGQKLSTAQIASRLPTTNPDAAPMLDRLLFLLGSFSVLDCDVLQVPHGDDGVRYERVYGLSPVGQYFVKDEAGNTLANLVKFLQDKVPTGSWYELGNSILEGGVPAFDRVHGMHIFEYNSKNPRLNQIFNQGLAGVSNSMIQLLLNEYKGFEHVHTLVDVGGGLGITLHNITSKYPSIKGINFDLPHVINDAPPFPRIEHVGGDMFESVPSGDAIFMKGVIHDWGDADCLKLLKNCSKALPDNGKVIAMDFILPVKPNTSASLRAVCQVDVHIMTVNTRGKERTEHEFRALAKGAGFRGIKVECHASQIGVIEMYK